MNMSNPKTRIFKNQRQHLCFVSKLLLRFVLNSFARVFLYIPTKRLSYRQGLLCLKNSVIKPQESAILSI